MFELLSTILQFVWDLLPLPRIIGPNERMTCFLLGKWGRVLKPGLYIIWPMVESCEEYTIITQVSETSILPVVNVDGNSYQLRIVVEYDISDVMTFHLSHADARLRLELLAGSTIINIVSQMTEVDIKEHGIIGICNAVKKRIKAPMKKNGINITLIRPVMFDRCTSLFISQAERLAE